jgi:hypothetical protein
MPTPISDYKKDSRFFGMFISRSGDGKSTAGASFAEAGSYINLDFDLRARGIVGSVGQNIISGDKVFYEEFSPIKGYAPLERFLEMQLAKYRSSGVTDYKTFQISSLFTLSRLLKNTSHELQQGKFLGKGDIKIRMDGPGDFNVEVSATHQLFDYFRMFPSNIILDAHLIDRYGKPDPKPGMTDNEIKALAFAQNEVKGTKLNVRDAYGESVLSYFDNVFVFSRDAWGKEMHYFVEFSTDMAKNTFGIPPGKHDITGMSFYRYFMDLTGKKLIAGKR